MTNQEIQTLCKCGCGEVFLTTNPRRKFLNEEHSKKYFNKKWNACLKAEVKARKEQKNPKERVCLKCEKVFKTRHNYICPTCTEINKTVLRSHTEEGALYGGEWRL